MPTHPQFQRPAAPQIPRFPNFRPHNPSHHCNVTYASAHVRLGAMLLATLFLLNILGSCSGSGGQRYADPIEVMVDRNAGYEQRRAAAEQARRETPGDPRRIKALNRILWQRRYPAWQRCDAIDELVEHDEPAFRASLQRRFGLLRNWDTINHIFDLAVRNQWDDFTPVAVVNYARKAHGIADLNRPERRVIGQLNPGKTVEQVLFEVFANADDRMSHRDQVAAWELLVRLTDPPTLADRLAAAPPHTPLVVDLKAAVAELHVVPRHREGVLWLQSLRHREQMAYWNLAAETVDRLTASQRRGLDLRHLPALTKADSDLLGSTQAELTRQIDALTRSTPRHMDGSRFDGPKDDSPHTIAASNENLAWADLVTMALILRAMQDPSLIEELFRQAERDRQDTSTEYGGVLDSEGGKFLALAYPPMVRRHDRKFVPSQEMIQRMYTGIAHYHFHAQQTKNARYAVPGEGDLKFANRLGATCLVFTSIDENRLNVDYYQPGRVIVDLGTVHR